MKLKRLCFLLILNLCLMPLNIYGGTFSQDNTNNNIYWNPKLSNVFSRIFNSSQEFANCQIFQKLGYNQGDLTQINQITPFSDEISINFDGIEEEIYESSAQLSIKVLRFSKLTAICKKAHFYNMIIDELAFTFDNALIDLEELDRGNLRFVAAEKVTLNVKVSEQDILSVVKLYPKAKLLSSVRFKFSNNKCQCRGKVKLGILVAEFNIKGYIKKQTEKKVEFVCERLNLNGISQPRAFVKTVMNYVNPVFDSSKFWLNLNITEMKIINGYVETLATIDKKEIKNGN